MQLRIAYTILWIDNSKYGSTRIVWEIMHARSLYSRTSALLKNTGITGAIIIENTVVIMQPMEWDRRVKH
jgi:hypothetical protein